MDLNTSAAIYPDLPPNGTLAYPTRTSPTYLAAGVSVAFVRGGSVWVSCGVNDSYNVILRFSLDQLMKRLQKNG